MLALLGSFICGMLSLVLMADMMNLHEEINFMKVPHFTARQQAIILGVDGLLLAHILFNRKRTLRIDKEVIKYSKGLIPGKRFSRAISDIDRVIAEGWEDPIAETPTGVDSTHYRVLIYWKNQTTPSKLKGLNERDCSLVVNQLNQLLS